MKMTGMLFSLAFLFFSTAHANSPTPLDSERMIYGDDNRLDLYEVQHQGTRALADSTVLLMSSSDLSPVRGGFNVKAKSYAALYGVCTTENYSDQPSAGFCSGALVAPDMIITAGHCISSLADCQTRSFVFGFAVQQKGVNPTTVLASDVYKCKEIVARKYTYDDSDFAIIRLDRKVTNHTPLPINRGAGPAVGDKIGVIGYPYGIPVKVAFDAQVRTADSTKAYFVANLDTFKGNSGSAVFNETTGNIEGILVRGDRDFVKDFTKGCYVNYTCKTPYECRGEDVTKISEVAPYIPL